MDIEAFNHPTLVVGKWIHESLLLAKFSHTWKVLALEQLETGTTTGADMTELLFCLVVGNDGSGITTSNDNSGTVGGSLNVGIKERFRARGKVGELKDTSRTVPKDSL